MHQSLLSSCTTTTLISASFLLFLCACVTPARALNSATQAFYPADFTYKAPVTIENLNGVDVIGVNTSLGCGYSDPVGNYAEDAAYFEVNFTTPDEYIYKLSISNYAPNSLSNSFWFFFIENVIRDEGPTKQEVSVPHNTKNEIRTSDIFCLHIGGSATIPNTFRFKPREPGALLANFTLTMVPQPKITEVRSACGGDCDLKKPIPMRVFFKDEICGATDTHAKFGNVIFTGPTGAEYSCSFRGQRAGPDGRWFVDCIVPTNVTVESDKITARVFWPTSSLMPPLDAATPAVVSTKSPSYAWIAAPAAVVALIVGYLCWVYYKKWKATKDAPRDANNLATMFVAARGVALLLEKFPKTAEAAIRAYDKIVRDACKTNNTYLARKIGESYLVVAKQPTDLFKASAEIQKTLEQTNWYQMLTGNTAPAAVVIKNKIKKNGNNKYTTNTHDGTLRTVSGKNTINSNQSGTINEDEEGGIQFYSQSSINRSINVESVDSSGDDKPSDSANKSKSSLKRSGSGLDGGDSAGDALNPFMENTGRVPLANRMVAKSNSNSKGSFKGRATKGTMDSSMHSQSEVSSHSRASTSRKTVNVAQSGITCSIAIVVGKGRITVHEAGTVSDYESFEYAGDVVDEAASVVDLAHSRQVLTISTVHDSVKKDISSLGSFTILEEKTHRGKHLKFIQFNPSGCEVITTGLQEEDNCESIQAQLDAASLGFASKVCTLLYLEIHGLTSNATREEDKKSFLDKYKSLYNPITEIVKHLGGTVINITSTNLVIAFNAFSPNPMHVTRGATCIYRLRDLFNSTTILKNFSLAKVSFCGGLATGSVVVGSVEADKSHKQIFGAAWDSAQSLMQMARARLDDGSMNCPVFALWNSRSDLNQQTIQFVDVVHVSGTNSQLQQHGRRQSNTATHTSSTSTPSPNGINQNLRGLIAIMKEQSKSANADDDNEDDNEWMYELANAEANNPYFHANEAYTCLLSNFLGDAEEKWNQVLKPKIEANEDDEMKKLEMVGLKQLNVIMEQGWEGYVQSLPISERL